MAQAAFALIYAHKKAGIIPGPVPELATADKSSVVRAALIQNERSLSAYAKRHGLEWATVTSKP